MDGSVEITAQLQQILAPLVKVTLETKMIGEVALMVLSMRSCYSRRVRSCPGSRR